MPPDTPGFRRLGAASQPMPPAPEQRQPHVHGLDHDDIQPRNRTSRPTISLRKHHARRAITGRSATRAAAHASSSACPRVCTGIAGPTSPVRGRRGCPERGYPRRRLTSVMSLMMSSGARATKSMIWPSWTCGDVSCPLPVRSSRYISWSVTGSSPIRMKLHPPVGARVFSSGIHGGGAAPRARRVRCSIWLSSASGMGSAMIVIISARTWPPGALRGKRVRPSLCGVPRPRRRGWLTTSQRGFLALRPAIRPGFPGRPSGSARSVPADSAVSSFRR